MACLTPRLRVHVMLHFLGARQCRPIAPLSQPVRHSTQVSATVPDSPEVFSSATIGNLMAAASRVLRLTSRGRIRREAAPSRALLPMPPSRDFLNPIRPPFRVISTTSVRCAAGSDFSPLRHSFSTGPAVSPMAARVARPPNQPALSADLPQESARVSVVAAFHRFAPVGLLVQAANGCLLGIGL